MNIFRLVGDLTHLAAIMMLPFNIWREKTVEGLSGKSQMMYMLIFATRYEDLFIDFVSYYNTIMKIIYLSLSAITCYLIYVRYRKSYQSALDSFCATPSAGLTIRPITF